MEPETLNAIRQHAVECYPRECCGLVIVEKGRERYVPCSNEAVDGTEHFILPAAEYAAAEERGEIVAVVHSHPAMLEARPSQGDLTACEASGLRWYIVAVALGEDGKPKAGEINTFAPSGYDPGYIGVEFAHGVNDCYSLCRRWYAKEWGLLLPDFPRRDKWWDDGHSDLYSQHFAECGFAPIAAPAQPGDAILMQISSANGVPNHAAIYLGDGRILHHLYGRMSSRDVYGGMFQQYTRLVVRHRAASEYLAKVAVA